MVQSRLSLTKKFKSYHEETLGEIADGVYQGTPFKAVAAFRAAGAKIENDDNKFKIDFPLGKFEADIELQDGLNFDDEQIKQAAAKVLYVCQAAIYAGEPEPSAH